MTRIHPICLLAAAVLTAMTAGCKSDSETDASSSSECAVTAVTMATLNRYLPSTATDGTRTTTKVSVTGANYPMSIDHLTSRIYNLDSLPAGTDVSRVAFATFSTSATPMIRSLVTLQDSAFVQTDSTDCRQIRDITVYAADGVTTHTYKLEVRVHKEWDDTVRWRRLSDAESYLAAADVHRAYCKEGALYVFGQEGTQPVVVTSPTQTPLTWTRTLLGNAQTDTRSIVLCGTTFYSLADGLVQESTDGVNWQPLTAAMPEGVTAFKALATAGSSMLVALTDKGFFSLDLKAAEWQKDVVDNAEMLPTADICGGTAGTAGDSNFESLVVVGKRAGKTVVWQRTIDLKGEKTFSWNYMADAGTDGLNLLTGISAAGYDGGILAGGQASGGALGSLYMSYDKGLTWSEKVVKRPEDADSKTSIRTAGSYAVATDADNYIYVFCGGTGEVWRGRINRLGWLEIQKKFTK